MDEGVLTVIEINAIIRIFWWKYSSGDYSGRDHPDGDYSRKDYSAGNYFVRYYVVFGELIIL